MTTSPTGVHADPSDRLAIASVVTSADTAPSVRAELVLTADDVDRIIRGAIEFRPELECVVVATCHRTEIVVAGPNASAAAAIELLHASLGRVRPDAAPCLRPDVRPTVHVDDDALRHLFRVACGLESELLGEAEILGQLKRAWHVAAESGAGRAVLRRTFRDAFAIGKRARSTTAIGDGGAGLGGAIERAVLAHRPAARGDASTGRPIGRVVVIGAGHAGRVAARRLAKSSDDVVVANRTLGRAEALAAEVGGRAIELTSIVDVIGRADVVVHATAGPPVITRALADRVRTSEPSWAPTVIDLGVAHTIDPELGVDLVDLDRLTTHHDDVRERRIAAVPDVEHQIECAIERHRAARRHTAIHRRPGQPIGTTVTTPPNKEHEPCAY